MFLSTILFWLLIGVFRSFTLNVIIDIFGCMSSFFFPHLLPVFLFLCFPFPAFFWITWICLFFGSVFHYNLLIVFFTVSLYSFVCGWVGVCCFVGFFLVVALGITVYLTFHSLLLITILLLQVAHRNCATIQVPLLPPPLCSSCFIYIVYKLHIYYNIHILYV